jgi:hypothetical protein
MRERPCLIPSGPRLLGGVGHLWQYGQAVPMTSPSRIAHDSAGTMHMST